MNARKLMIVAALLVVTCGAVKGASVTWRQGTIPPAGWAISPASPGTGDVITFLGPTDVYSNSCVGESNLGGTPQLLIDSVSKVVLLWFQGPAPSMCTLIYMPVDALQGDFGPLEAGDWTFTCLSKALPFEIHFTVGGQVSLLVDKDAPGPAHNGQTWATAFLTPQDALAVAGAGDEILVAEGVYKPDQGVGVTPGDREATFELKDGVAVKGGYAGYGQPNPDARDPEFHETVLSGDLSGNDLWGILNRNENSYHVVTGPPSGSAMLDGFSVRYGQADGPFPHHLGAGLYNDGGELKVLNCTVQGNTAAFGGGILNLGAPLTMVNTQLIDNRTFVSGGGLYNYEGDAVLHNCRIVGNTADQAAVMGGAAIDNLNGTLTLRNCTVADNYAPNGMAIASYSWDFGVSTTVDVANSILYNGGTEISTNNVALVTVAYSNVQGGWTGTGNVNVDPQFVALGARGIEGEWIDGDYRLSGASACIDAGSNSSLPADVLDLDGDGNIAEQLPLDLDNETRILGTRVDMGAYEQTKGIVGPPPSIDLTICFGGNCIHLLPDPVLPYTYIGSTTVEFELNFTAKLTAVATATSAAGGTWTAWFVPDIISPGSPTTTLWVKGENLDLSALPAGSTNVQVAEVTIYAAPAP
jgi:hypothetical protein